LGSRTIIGCYFRSAGGNLRDGEKQVRKTGILARRPSRGALAAASQVKNWIASHRPELVKGNVMYFGIAFHGMDGEEDSIDAIQTIGFDFLTPTDRSCVSEVKPLLIHLLRCLIPEDFSCGNGGGGTLKAFTQDGKVELQSFYYSLKTVANEDVVI